MLAAGCILTGNWKRDWKIQMGAQGGFCRNQMTIPAFVRIVTSFDEKGC